MATTSYSDWPSESHARWIRAGHTFGRHLMAAARDYAFDQIPESATPKVREAAKKAALDAIYGMMMLLDGVADATIDESHVMEYALLARVHHDKSAEVIEEIELAPDGDGLCMGFHYWVDGDFDPAS